MRTLCVFALWRILCIFSDAKDCSSLATPGDFEQGAREWELTGQILVDPLNPANHVMALRRNDVDLPSASAPLNIPDTVNALEVRFRLLAPKDLKLSFSSKLLLRVRLYSAEDNSRIQELEIQRSPRWQMITVRFNSIGEFRSRVLIEALNSGGPFYVDDFCVIASKHEKRSSPAPSASSKSCASGPTGPPEHVSSCQGI